MELSIEKIPGDRFQIFIDGEPWRIIHQSIFGKKPKLTLKATSLEEMEKKFLELEQKRVKFYILRRIAAKNYSTYELRQLLKDRYVSQSLIEPSIQNYVEQGYINDRAWLEGKVLHYVRQKHGPRSILSKLRAKGVPEEDVEEFIESLATSEDQLEGIDQLIKSKYKKRDLSDFKERQKVIAALMRRGFSFDKIETALRSLNKSENFIA